MLSKMDPLESAGDALRRCETEIQVLLAEAASSGKYDEIDRLTVIARSLGEMARGETSALRLDSPADTAVSRLNAYPSSPSRPRRGGKARGEYPKFGRDGDDLVKTGWSKKKREEYVHRARRTQVQSIVLFLVGRAKREHGTIPITEILGATDLGGTEIPNYQVYLTLAWLRREGLLERQGRNGYVVLDQERLELPFAALWSSLPEYQAS